MFAPEYLGAEAGVPARQSDFARVFPVLPHPGRQTASVRGVPVPVVVMRPASRIDDHRRDDCEDRAPGHRSRPLRSVREAFRDDGQGIPGPLASGLAGSVRRVHYSDPETLKRNDPRLA